MTVAGGITFDQNKLGKVAQDLVGQRGKLSPEMLATLVSVVAIASGSNPILAGVGAGLTKAFASALSESATQRFLAAGERWDDEQALIDRISKHLEAGVKSYAAGDWSEVLEVIGARLSQVALQADENLAALAKLIVATADRAHKGTLDAVERLERMLAEQNVGERLLASQQAPVAVVLGRVENLHLHTGLVSHSGESVAYERLPMLEPPTASRETGDRTSDTELAHGKETLSHLVPPVEACVTGNKHLLQFCAVMLFVSGVAGLLCGFSATAIASHSEGWAYFSSAGLFLGLVGCAVFLSYKPDLAWVTTKYLRGRSLLAKMLRILGLPQDPMAAGAAREAGAFVERCEKRCTHG